MKVKGLKEIKNGAKLLNKKLKLEAKLQKEANKYFDAVGFENRNLDYFISCCKAYNNQNKRG